MLTILTAHHGEARPFIEHYGLERQRIGEIDQLVGRRVRLLVTGEGAVRVGDCLTRMLSAERHAAIDAVLNFGVAGSAQFEVGTLVAIESGWPGSMRNKMPFPVSHCHSVDQRSEVYPPSGVIDREFATIHRLLGNRATSLLAVKLVSDGPARSIESLGRVGLTELIDSAAKAICRFSDMMIRSSNDLEAPDDSR